MTPFGGKSSDTLSETEGITPHHTCCSELLHIIKHVSPFLSSCNSNVSSTSSLTIYSLPHFWFLIMVLCSYLNRLCFVTKDIKFVMLYVHSPTVKSVSFISFYIHIILYDVIFLGVEGWWTMKIHAFNNGTKCVTREYPHNLIVSAFPQVFILTLWNPLYINLHWR